VKRLERGDVVTALFFKDKPRPGVVIRASRYVESENVTLCPLTSTLAGGPLRVRVMPGLSGLKRESEILPYRITTLPAHRIGEPIGRLSYSESHEMDSVLREWLALDEK
jgi:mRNA-degrading endonuclease toxin of MazEF toxin-antitoxin module